MNDAERFVQSVIEKEGGMQEIPKAIELIQAYRLKEYSYESKNLRLSQWEPTDEELYELIICVFTAVLTGGFLTYQAMVGRLNHHIKMDDLIDRIKTLAEVIAIISRTGLIEIVRSGSGQYLLINTDYDLGEEIPFVDAHATVYHRPQPVESNWDPEQGSMLLGGHLNHHEGNLCLDHINKMNSIPMALNKAFLLKYPEEPKKASTIDTPRKEQHWKLFVKRGMHKYAQMLAGKNTCYLNHKYCTRGRTYACGYYISTQGSSYKKAMIQLAKKEYLNAE